MSEGKVVGLHGEVPTVATVQEEKTRAGVIEHIAEAIDKKARGETTWQHGIVAKLERLARKQDKILEAQELAALNLGLVVSEMQRVGVALNLRLTKPVLAIKQRMLRKIARKRKAKA
jgi:hypothetical protein